MQYDAETPADYIAMLEDDWRRRTLQELRALIKLNAPTLAEGIEYKMLRYGNVQGPVFHLNAQKNYVSLYVGDTNKIDPKGELLEGLDLGKGCIRFKKSVAVTETRIDDFIKKADEMRARGEDIGC